MKLLTKEKSRQKRKGVNNQNNSSSYFRLLTLFLHHHYHLNEFQLRNEKSGTNNGEYFRIHLNKFGRLILSDNYNAMPHGAVPSKTYDYTKHSVENYFDSVEFDIVSTLDSYETDVFSKSDLEIMNFVWDKYGNKHQYELERFAHYFPEWLRYKNELNDKYLPNSYSIVMDDFFISPLPDADYSFNEEESNISKTKFHYNSTLQSFLSE